jgi:hypothetical protein
MEEWGIRKESSGGGGQYRRGGIEKDLGPVEKKIDGGHLSRK